MGSKIKVNPGEAKLSIGQVGLESEADNGSEHADSEEIEGGEEEATTADQPNFFEFLRAADDTQLKQRLAAELQEIVDAYASSLTNYCLIGLFDTHLSIGTFHTDQIYLALENFNPERDKDILLVLVSQGGQPEAAYQISRLCQHYSKRRFIVVIPRRAKSAATLLALGGNEIHMGLLGELGPIDPQIGGLPALGVGEALKAMAELSNQYPHSAEMFARYMAKTLEVSQIGYYQRASESALQYAERLLANKTSLPRNPTEIARHLVYSYKDHGFVIDRDETLQILGDHLVKTDSAEVEFGNLVYQALDLTNLVLGLRQKKALTIVGSLIGTENIWIWPQD